MKTIMLHARLRNDDGFTLPDVIVSAIVGLISLSIIATAIFTFTALQLRFAAAAGVTTAAATIDTMLRQDLYEATTLRAQSAGNLIMTVSRNGACQEVTWWLEHTPNTDSLAIGTRACGTETAADTTQYPLKPNTTSQFSYRNIGGRGLTVENGTMTLAAGTAPATVPADNWASHTVGSVTLDVTLLGYFGAETIIHSTQQTSPLSRLTRELGTPTAFVVNP